MIDIITFFLEPEVSKENTIPRKPYEGYLEGWGFNIVIDDKTGQKFQDSVAIVSDIETGKVYRVPPEWIRFHYFGGDLK